MQVLAKTEYQDVYRVTDGVLLIVNKFEYMFDQLSPVDYSGRRRKMYHKNTKDLTINQEDKIHYGQLLGIDDFINYHADNIIDLEKQFHDAVDNYIEIKKRN